ncbi:MAG: TetR/AcrR family transcriptional regulator [Rhodospirillales bacterium]|jgi:AcrR family transcriptional regulator|nr:TetR/AcrR family transcriptional regulator [Rhodospirillales bacterium]|tara:strand:+ start:610 stop:972 length:363 start_codon:yes stop_codon:yes gene_type:complete
MQGDVKNLSPKPAGPTGKTPRKKRKGGLQGARHVGRPRTDDSQPSGDLRVLEAALEAFSQHGYDGVSTSEIATAADVAQSVVHYHFGDKETLWRAAVDFLFDRVRNTEPLPSSETDEHGN